MDGDTTQGDRPTTTARCLVSPTDPPEPPGHCTCHMTLHDFGPFLDTGSRVGVILITVFMSIRLLNAQFASTAATWEQAAATLTESANYARAETAELHTRIDQLEAEAVAYARDRHDWLVERARFVSRIEHLERKVARLTTELDDLKDPDNV